MYVINPVYLFKMVQPSLPTEIVPSAARPRTRGASLIQSRRVKQQMKTLDTHMIKEWMNYLKLSKHSLKHKERFLVMFQEDTILTNTMYDDMMNRYRKYLNLLFFLIIVNYYFLCASISYFLAFPHYYLRLYAILLFHVDSFLLF